MASWIDLYTSAKFQEISYVYHMTDLELITGAQ